jgi:N-acyl-L-homoserine lactone synthetase
MEKLFHINPSALVLPPQASLWHVGRFAVDSQKGVPGIILFKQLMFLAIMPICGAKEPAYMLAECDSKLLRIMGLLGIKTTCLGASLFYLGSETVPVIASKQGLETFYMRCSAMYQANMALKAQKEPDDTTQKYVSWPSV